MSLSKYAATKVFDTTQTGMQGGPNPNDGSGSYTTFALTLSPSNKTPHGYGSIVRKIYRFAQTSVVETTIPGDTSGPNIWTDDYLNT